jgi:NAD(P)-dependent dehydrogenase (short-subunit alcohol dehydrogenase family)
MRGRLAGKTIVVTGGTTGIGKGIAGMAATEGAHVVIGDRDSESGAWITGEPGDGSRGTLMLVEVDIARVDDCRRLIETAERAYGRVDGLVNNAGIFPRGSIEDTSEELYDRVLDVNAKGAFFCTQFAVRSMVKSGGGSIVNIGSTHWLKGSRELAAYACSKGALHSLTTYVAVNYAGKGIRSNWITVGWVASEGEIERFRGIGKGPEDLEAMARERIPSGRLQTPEDNAYAAVYLLSDESAQVTGTDLHVTGGFNY